MKKITIAILLALTFIASFVPYNVSAASVNEQLCKAADKNNDYDPVTGQCTTPGKELTGSPDSYLNIFTNLLLYIAGAIAVIVIIIGGIRYITSTGDALRVKQAKDTILYGIVGLVVAIIAWALVNYIVDTLG